MTSAARHLSVVGSNDDIAIEGESWPLIPEGVYQAAYLGHRTALVFGQHPCVMARFQLVGAGDHYGVELARPYRVARVIGKPRDGGTFTLRPRSLLHLELCRLTETRRKPSRVSMSVLRGLVLRVTVRTVERAWDQRLMPKALRYSVVDKLLDVYAGSLQ